jgi:MYXO-CTERM domain-containing protein
MAMADFVLSPSDPKMLRATLVRSLAAASLTLLSVGAHAAPESLASTATPAGVIVTGFDVTAQGTVAVAGTSLRETQFLPTFHAHAIAGTLESLNDVSGALTEQETLDVTGGATRYGANVWVARADQVMRLSAGQWQAASAPGRLDALHAFDADTLVGVGEGGVAARSTDGGATWTAAPTGTDADLKGMFWRGSQDGWAWGHTVVMEGGGFDGGEETRSVTETAVLRTTDGGATWTVVASDSGVALGPVFFLADGQTGWMAVSELAPEGKGATVELMHTTDGGQIWGPVALPSKVGTVSSAFATEDVDLSTVASMWWDDADNGRLFVTAHLLDATTSESGGGGGNQGPQDASAWKILELVTDDGGATWDYDDLGTIEVEFSFEGTTIDHDGPVAQGIALSWSRHALLGGDRVWFTQDWGNDPRGDTSGDDGEGGTGDGTGDDGGDDGDGRPPRGLPSGAASDGGGCTVSAGGSASDASLALLLLGAAFAVRRRR